MPGIKQADINAAAAAGLVVVAFAVGSKGLPRKQFPHSNFEETLSLPPELAAEAVAYWIALADRADKVAEGGAS